MYGKLLYFFRPLLDHSETTNYDLFLEKRAADFPNLYRHPPFSSELPEEEDDIDPELRAEAAAFEEGAREYDVQTAQRLNQIFNVGEDGEEEWEEEEGVDWDNPSLLLDDFLQRAEEEMGATTSETTTAGADPDQPSASTDLDLVDRDDGILDECEDLGCVVGVADELEDWQQSWR